MYTSFKPLRLCFILSLIPLLLTVSCGEDDSSSKPGNGGENEILNNLSFVRQDDTPLIMGTDYAICCAIWEEGHIDKNTLKIFFYDPLFATEPENADSFWKLFIIVDEVTVGNQYNFPTAADDPVKVFLVDAVSSNELSGDANDSTGTVTINSLDCGPPLSVSLTIDATIGSEFHLEPTVHISGTFNVTIYANPSPLGCDFSM